ncbi:acetyl-CoA carboxylase, carboxyltransferase subunit beta [Fodinibius sp.]|uniref:acetyl-CoA carboxylase, carboxyltransferase subunit beta n=1 Tax=Fodinibius sp. TaxID=1872440 RepID=UPI003566BC77
MDWFKRKDKNIQTDQRKEMPEGVWIKVPKTGETVHRREVEDNLWVDPLSGYHFRIGSEEYFSFLFDDGVFEEIGQEIVPTDPLNFEDRKKYSDRLEEYQEKTGHSDAVRVGVGTMNELEVVIGCMDFDFIGGSMGSVVGERLARAIDHAREHKVPLVIISQSGGARMMESVLSLMQMAKTSAKLAQLEEEGVPYISVLTNPTTGGVTASFAMLGDFNIAEPEALIGFAGPRVIRQTIGRDLPEDFQRSEYLLEHGFLDFITPRNQMKGELTKLLKILLHKFEE